MKIENQNIEVEITPITWIFTCSSGFLGHLKNRSGHQNKIQLHINKKTKPDITKNGIVLNVQSLPEVSIFIFTEKNMPNLFSIKIAQQECNMGIHTKQWPSL